MKLDWRKVGGIMEGILLFFCIGVTMVIATILSFLFKGGV